MRTDWPAAISLTRHAESAGNVARDRALAAGAERIDIEPRDADVTLSATGERQAAALGRWLGRNGAPFDAVLSSPYARARRTAELALAAAGWRDVPLLVDERLREKELGALDRLTRLGIERRYPAESASRAVLGKYWYRPPGGESWVDVILRLRSLVETLRRDHAERRVLIVAHQVVVLCMRAIVEGLDESQILAIDRAGDVANCSLTTYELDRASGRPALRTYNDVEALAEEGAAVTREPAAARRGPDD